MCCESTPNCNRFLLLINNSLCKTILEFKYHLLRKWVISAVPWSELIISATGIGAIWCRDVVELVHNNLQISCKIEVC